MNRFGRVWLMLPLVAFAILPAGAQVTIDVSKITCEQYVLFTVADPRDIAMWLSGYYNGKRNNTVLDTQEFRERARKVMEYCQLNPKATVMEAVEKVVGVTKQGRRANVTAAVRTHPTQYAMGAPPTE